MKKLTLLSLSFLTILTLSVVTIYLSSCNSDPCKNVTCMNGGTTQASGSTCNCNCTTGYEGSTCQTKSTDKFVGTYNATDVGGGQTFTYPVTITASSTIANGIILSNFGGFGSTFSVTGNVNGSSFTLNNYTSNGITISNASGSISGNTISVTYDSTDSNGTVSNTGTWIKQ